MGDRRFRILALDADGTLLDPSGTLRPLTIEAVTRAADAGIVPVICTGRRYRRALPIAQRLEIKTPIVCNSGALLKDPHEHRTIWRADIEPTVLEEVFRTFHDQDELFVSFFDRSLGEPDFYVSGLPEGRPLLNDFLDQNREHAEVNRSIIAGPSNPHYHLCAVGTPSAMRGFQAELVSRLGDRIQTFVQRSPRYAGTMCEVLRHDATKWSALLQLANLWGVEAEAICAVGDDMNDLPMLRGAGLGVAMGHANAEVLAASDMVTGTNEDDGVATLIDRVLLA